MKSLYIRPLKDFSSLEQLRKLCGCEADAFAEMFRKLLLFDIPLIAVILDDHSQILWSPTLYLADVALTSRSCTGDTVRTYSESILQWYRYLDIKSVAPAEATEWTFKSYRHFLTNSLVPKTQKKRASATVVLRMNVAAFFHLWSYDNEKFYSPLGEWISSVLPGDYSDNVVRGRRSGHLGTPAIINRLPVAIPSGNIQDLISSSINPYRLGFKWGVCTGIRRFELCNLTISDVVAARESASLQKSFGKLNIKRKGGRSLDLYAPVGLLDETWWYIESERPTPKLETGLVFVTDDGGPLTRAALTNRYADAAVAAGLPSTLHHLRHTFAVNTYHHLSVAAVAGAQINPLKILQIMMGHASMESSEIYLRAMEVQSDEVRGVLDYLYGATHEN